MRLTWSLVLLASDVRYNWTMKLLTDGYVPEFSNYKMFPSSSSCTSSSWCEDSTLDFDSYAHNWSTLLLLTSYTCFPPLLCRSDSETMISFRLLSLCSGCTYRSASSILATLSRLSFYPFVISCSSSSRRCWSSSSSEKSSWKTFFRVFLSSETSSGWFGSSQSSGL